MKTPEVLTRPAPDAQVPRRFPRSKTWAVRHLSKFFVRPAIQDLGREAAGTRWRVVCHNRKTGKVIPLVDVTGPVESLAKAAVMAACQRIGVAVTFDAAGGVSFKRGALP
jgi:hypothetical protein